MSPVTQQIEPNEPAKIVMVVDADILARMALADFLRHCGYKVIEGASGAEVVRVLEAGHDVQVLLIDMQLQSSEDSFAIAQMVRAKYPEITIIHTSSAAKLADKAGELCEDGPHEDDPLIKPYQPQELLARIKRLRQQRERS